MNSTSRSVPAGPAPHGLFKLLASTAIVLAIWLGVLPGIARMEPVESHLQMLREHHIDAGAMFYSELDSRVFPDWDELDEFLRDRGGK